MSEPMSKIEIEDVLSSIRRLVTEDVRQRPPRPGLLVLTPALRVSEEELEPLAGPPDPDPDPEPEVAAHIAEAEEEEPFEPADFAEPEDLTGAEDLAGLEEAEPLLGAAVSIESRIAELEAAIGASDEEFEPDGSEGDAHSSFAESLLRQTRGPLEADDSGDPEPAPDAETAEAAMPSPEPAEAEDRLDADDPDFLEWTADPQDAAPADAPPAAAAPPPQAGPGTARPLAEAAQAGLEEALIDEDALREIVADLVREQLRGELGERITRNVRRLIRREIHRALALKELAEDDDI